MNCHLVFYVIYIGNIALSDICMVKSRLANMELIRGSYLTVGEITG